MTPKIELVQFGDDSLELDDVRSVKGEGKSKRIGFLPRIDNASLRFVVPLSDSEVEFALQSVKELRQAVGMTVADQALRQLDPKKLAAALKRGKK